MLCSFWNPETKKTEKYICWVSCAPNSARFPPGWSRPRVFSLPQAQEDPFRIGPPALLVFVPARLFSLLLVGSEGRWKNNPFKLLKGTWEKISLELRTFMAIPKSRSASFQRSQLGWRLQIRTSLLQITNRWGEAQAPCHLGGLLSP